MPEKSNVITIPKKLIAIVVVVVIIAISYYAIVKITKHPLVGTWLFYEVDGMDNPNGVLIFYADGTGQARTNVDLFVREFDWNTTSPYVKQEQVLDIDVVLTNDSGTDLYKKMDFNYSIWGKSGNDVNGKSLQLYSSELDTFYSLVRID